MAGIFWPQIKIFNRAPTPLAVMFDGERKPIPVGFSELPEQTVYHAKNQNPIMGSADPHNPGVRGTRCLIVTEGEDGFGTPLTQEEWEEHMRRPCREDEQIWFQERYGDDKKARLVTHGSRNSVAARNRSETTVKTGLAEFTGREA